MAAYALEGQRWGRGEAGSGAGPVTWTAAASLPSFFLADIQAAFADWSAHADITFQQVAPASAAQITLGESPIDGPSNTLGTTDYAYSGRALTSATVTFDTGEDWHVSGSQVVSRDQIDLFVVALHEIGHSIGLDHYDAVPAVMNARLNPAVTDLTSSDIAGVQALYGPPVAATSPAASPAPVTAALPAFLVDGAFYLAAYPEVRAAGADPATHYAQWGWHEGRDPDAYFSTAGYLAANPDVAAAGIDPLVHYDATGWREGRDPSASFDDELYLARNPDVKAAGIDPLQHFLAYGHAEGRQAYAAVGRVGDIAARSGFDAEYYLLANPDVAKAAVASGSDTFAFAFKHYETNGWHEGRNPNAVFDTKGYLGAYADVRAAGMDPLAHYDLYGWKEGRDPSASFDTKAYESHYADVKAAGIDPMLHYLENGGIEGRSTFADGAFGHL